MPKEPGWAGRGLLHSACSWDSPVQHTPSLSWAGQGLLQSFPPLRAACELRVVHPQSAAWGQWGSQRFPGERRAEGCVIDLLRCKERTEHLGPAIGWLTPWEISLPEVRRAQVSFVPFVLVKNKNRKQSFKDSAPNIENDTASLFGDCSKKPAPVFFKELQWCL